MLFREFPYGASSQSADSSGTWPWALDQGSEGDGACSSLANGSSMLPSEGAPRLPTNVSRPQFPSRMDPHAAPSKNCWALSSSACGWPCKLISFLLRSSLSATWVS